MTWEPEAYAHYMGEGEWDEPLPGEEPVEIPKQPPPTNTEDQPEEDCPF